MAAVTLKQLLEAGVHFGHQTSRWNPKMKPYIFTARNGIHIIDLAQTVKLLEEACKWVTQEVANGGSVLFVGTKKQAQGIIQEEAKRSGQHYVNHRWMGGMLTNFTVIQQRFNRMRALREMRDTGQFEQMSKKEAAKLEDELDKLERNFGGMAELKRLPSAVYVVDPRKEHIAVTEAGRLKIPVIAITDSNCDPELIRHVIPGNDDAIRAVKLITARLADACIEGRASRPQDKDEEGAEGPSVVPEPAAVAAAVAAAAAPPEALPEAPVQQPESAAVAVAEKPAVAEPEPAEAPPAEVQQDEVPEDEEVKPEPEVDEEEFAKELEGLDEQDKMMGDA
ncbi:MAG: 30S ribosomal protein S2 [Candidatus Dormibacteria bacterium]